MASERAEQLQAALDQITEIAADELDPNLKLQRIQTVMAGLSEQPEDCEREPIHLPAFLSTTMGISRSEARRVIHQGGVEHRGEVCRDLDIPREQFRPKSLKVGAAKKPDQPEQPEGEHSRSELKRLKALGGPLPTDQPVQGEDRGAGGEER